jgi:addiction module HigA family antidote
MTMKNPPHPGEHVLNGKNGVSPEMAIRLSKAFGGRPEVWLGMQMQYDLAQA